MWDQKEWWRVLPESYSCEGPALNSQWPCSLPFAGRHSAGGENGLILRSRDRQEEPGSFQSADGVPKVQLSPCPFSRSRKPNCKLTLRSQPASIKIQSPPLKKTQVTHGWRFFSLFSTVLSWSMLLMFWNIWAPHVCLKIIVLLLNYTTPSWLLHHRMLKWERH